jgi:hypothetical protein
LLVVVIIAAIRVRRVMPLAVAWRRLRNLPRQCMRSRCWERLLRYSWHTWNAWHPVHRGTHALSHILLLREEVRLGWRRNPLSWHLVGWRILPLEMARRRWNILHSRWHHLVHMRRRSHLILVRSRYFFNFLFSLDSLLPLEINLLYDFLNESIQLFHLLLVSLYSWYNRLESSFNNVVVQDILSPQSS